MWNLLLSLMASFWFTERRDYTLIHSSNCNMNRLKQ